MIYEWKNHYYRKKKHSYILILKIWNLKIWILSAIRCEYIIIKERGKGKWCLRVWWCTSMRTKQTKIYFNQGSVLSKLIITQTKKTDIGSCHGEVMGNSCNLRISVSLNNQSQYGDLSIPTPGSTRLNKLLPYFKKILPFLGTSDSNTTQKRKPRAGECHSGEHLQCARYGN